MIEILKYSEKFSDQWNEFLKCSKNSTFLFNRNFMGYHSDRLDDFSLIIMDNKKIVGLLPANIDDLGNVISHQGLSYGGFIFGRNEKLNNISKYIYSTLKFLSENDIDNLFYKSFPRFYNTVGSDEIEYNLFLLKGDLYRRDSALVIDLKNKIEFQTRRKRSIKKAEKFNIEIIESNSFSEFWNKILIPNLKLKHDTFPVHSLDEIELLANRFPENIKQFNALLDNKIVAGTTIFETPTVAHAQYISSSEEGRNNGGLDFLFDQLINDKYSKKNYFDFGISNENQGKSLNHGLLDWKEGFGGRAFSHDFYEISTKNFNLLENIIKW